MPASASQLASQGPWSHGLPVQQQSGEDVDETSSVEIFIKRPKRQKKSGATDDLQGCVSHMRNKSMGKMMKPGEATKAVSTKAKQTTKSSKSKTSSNTGTSRGLARVKLMNQARKVLGIATKKTKKKMA